MKTFCLGAFAPQLQFPERANLDGLRGHPRKVMASYQAWFGEGPELSLLRILGLFDRPAQQSALEALVKWPAISGLTESLTDLRPAEWRTIVARLRRARLLAGDDPSNPGQLDTQRGNTSFAANFLAAREALLAVLVYYFENGRWGSLVSGDVKGAILSAEDQLFILMQAGLYLTVTRGQGTPDAFLCYKRAEPLCRSLARPMLLYVALIGQWRYFLISGKLPAALQIAKRVYTLVQEQNNPALMIGAYRALASTLYWSGDFETARQYALHGVQVWRSGDGHSQVEELHAPAVACLCIEALSEWHIGEVDSCQPTIEEAISLAKELNDMHALVLALWYAGILGHFEGKAAEVERRALQVIDLSTRQAFQVGGAQDSFCGAGRAALPVKMLKGLRGSRKVSKTFGRPAQR